MLGVGVGGVGGVGGGCGVGGVGCGVGGGGGVGCGGVGVVGCVAACCLALAFRTKSSNSAKALKLCIGDLYIGVFFVGGFLGVGVGLGGGGGGGGACFLICSLTFCKVAWPTAICASSSFR